MRLEDEIVRRFVPLVDGTRTVDQLVSELQIALFALGERVKEESTVVTRDSVVQNLSILRQLALLETR